VAVGFGAVVAKAAQDIDADLFGGGEGRMGLKQLQQPGQHIDAAPCDLDEPGLVVDASRCDMDIFAMVDGLLWPDQPLAPGPELDAAGDLPVRAHDAMAEADRGTPPYLLQAQTFIAMGLA